MKNYILKIPITLSILLLIANCENNLEEEPSNLKRENYLKFSEVYSYNLNKAATGLRESNSTFSEIESLEKTVLNSLDQEIIDGFNTYQEDNIYDPHRSSTENSNSANFTLDNLNLVQKNQVKKILESVNKVETLNEYYSYLNDAFDKTYYSNDISIEDKDFILTYLTVFKTSLTFLEENSDLISINNNSEYSANIYIQDKKSGIREWFEKKWRCVAGTVGMAIGTGGALCGVGWTVGSGVGTLLGPPGTVSGGITGCIIGGAIGAIGGGLIGVATFC